MTELLTATDLDQWSERNDSREHLPTLVRRLILAVAAPESLRMPAAEGVGLPGLDGDVVSPTGAPPFLPAGRSVWELGTSRDPAAKAQRDYRSRLKACDREQRSGVTFVFVTSRRWPDSQDWIARRTADDDGWLDIRVLDAEDLAAWLAQCPGVHRWLASEQLGRDPYGVVGLRDWFRNWAERTQPAIPSALLLAGRAEHAERLREGLRAAPSSQVIASASSDESLAFLAASLLAEPPASTTSTSPHTDAQSSAFQPAAMNSVSAELGALLERTLVVEDARAWRRAVAHEKATVIVPTFSEPEIGDALRAGHHVVLPRAGRPTDDRLPRLHRHLARDAWIAAGLDHDRAEDYARAARRSLASLRRRIGRPGGLRQPPWASDGTANLLAPLLLAGAWADDVDGDLQVLQGLSDRGWRATARELSTLTSGEDAPLLRRDRRWEFADPIDAWDALRYALTAEDLDAFQSLAHDVLGESDPASGLTSQQRIAASLSEEGVPRRRYSNTLRRGVATTAALLGAVVGDQDLPGRLTGQQRASRVVQQLLGRADAARWQALADLLPLLAEASPQAFLTSVEGSLAQSEPLVMALFTETQDDLGLSSRSAHCSLLWALEMLAWCPSLLSRVVVVLARLAERDPGGRLANRPGASLAAALHVGIPQGAVNSATRIAALDAVRITAPTAAWELQINLVRQVDRGLALVNGPTFRDWQRPQVSTINDHVDAIDALAARIAQDAGEDSERFAAALALIDRFREAGRLALLSAAGSAWPNLHEEGRRTVIASLAGRVAAHRRHPSAVWALPDQALQPLEAFLDGHVLPGSQPNDAELFSWLPFGPGLDADQADSNPEVLCAARAEAIRRTLSDGLPAVLRLAEAAQQPAVVGDALARVTADYDSEVLDCLADPAHPRRAMAAGLSTYRQAQDPDWLSATVSAKPQLAAALCRTAAIDEALLRLVQSLEPQIQDEFWRAMHPWGVRDELARTVARRLLDHGRCWTAMDLLCHTGFGDDPDLALRALTTAGSSAEPVESATSPDFVVGQLLDQLQAAATDDAVLAGLEWFYQPLLNHSRMPQALHRQLARDPARFVELVSIMYQADPHPSSPPIDDATEDAGSARAQSAAWSVLREWRAPLPGSQDGGLPTSADMLQWLDEARRTLTELGRTRVLPLVLGDALAGAATDHDGTWPSEPVRDVLESLQDADLEEHLAIAKMNQRGVTSRGVYDGGTQERALAERYAEAADRVRSRWPRSGALLDGLSQDNRTDGRRHDRSADEQGDL